MWDLPKGLLSDRLRQFYVCTCGGCQKLTAGRKKIERFPGLEALAVPLLLFEN